MTPTGPCLVEVGARPHGGEGTFMPMGDVCYGTNQVAAYAASVLDEKAWNAVPNDIGKWKKYAIKVDLVCNVAGKQATHVRNMAAWMTQHAQEWYGG